MNRYTRILEKAQLDQDLFGADPKLDAVSEFSSSPELERVEPLAATETVVSVFDKPETTAAEEPKPQEKCSVWRDELAQVLHIDPLKEHARVALCPLGSVRSAAECASALGQWIASCSSLPALIVEASFDSPQLSRLFRTRRLGLAEAMASTQPNWGHFVHDTLYDNLKVLPAGRNPQWKQLLNDQEAFQRILDELSGLYGAIIVALPNPRSKGFDKLRLAKIADLVFPVIQPGHVAASQAGKAIRKLTAGSARVAAALVVPKLSVEQTRMEQLAIQLNRAAGGDSSA